MFVSIALATAMAAPTTVQPKIVAASLFKNGYAVVTREIDVPAGGVALVADMPAGALGTVWITTTDGIKLASVKNIEVKEESRVKADSMAAFLKANEGKSVELTITGDKIVVGTIASVSDQIVLFQSAGSASAIPIGEIVAAGIRDGGKVDSPSMTTHRALEIRVEGGKAGRLYIFGLERGLTWAPSYSLDISDSKKLKFVAKAEILNDLGDLSNIEAWLVTGFPNVYFANVPDPLLARTSVDAYIQSLGASDAQSNARAGGFGGGQMANNSNAVFMSYTTGNVADAMAHDNPGGIEEGDLFFYRQPHVNLDKGERAYYILADASLDYKEIYTWDSVDTVSNDRIDRFNDGNEPPAAPDSVWHSLEFKNTVGQPLTTGPATTWKDGELLGQDLSGYVSKDSKALVKITKALDIHAESADEEVDRKRQALNVPGYGPFDLVTLKTTLKATNTKSETVHLRVTRAFTGELLAFDDAVVAKNTKGLRSINPTGKLTWERDLAPGKTLTLTFSVHVYVRSGGG